MSKLLERLATSTGTIYYVATTGSDSTGEGTAAKPWKTVAKALGVVANGSIIELAEGEYPFEFWEKTASEAAPITIRAAAGKAVTFHYVTGQQYARFANCKYLRTEGIVFKDNNGEANVGIWCSGTSKKLEFLNCVIHDMQRSNCFSDQTTEEIHYVNCISYKAGRRQEATHNLDHGWYMAGKRHMLLNCIGYENDAMGVQLYNEGNESLIAHCLFWKNGKGGIIIGGENSTFYTKKSKVRNTLCIANGTYGLTHSWGGTVGSENSVDHLIAFGNTTAQVQEPPSGYTLENLLTSNPKLVNAEGHNFHVEAASPAIGAGDPEYTPAFDLDNNPRTDSTLGPYAAPAAVITGPLPGSLGLMGVGR